LPVREALRLLEIPYWMACSKTMPSGMTDRLKAAVTSAHKDQLVRKLYEKYGLADIYPVIAPRGI
jgi:hypothetical protein